MALRTFTRSQVGRKYHVEYPTPKHVENSLRGTRWMARHGYKTTDLDMLPDEVLYKAVMAGRAVLPIAGHIANEHWPDPFRRDGFRDPKGHLGRGDHMHEMVPEEWRRIVAGHRPRLYHISPIERQLALCAELGKQALLEPKESPVWLCPEVWTYLARIAAHYGTRTAVYSMQHECIPLARRAGFNAWRI